MSKWTSSSPSDTWNIAAEFFQTLDVAGRDGRKAFQGSENKKGEGSVFPVVIALHGNLGAGKTCFTQGLARAAGVTEPVCSPTYTLISEYQGTVPFHHIDLYRLTGPEEAYDLGFDEYLETDGIIVIEWAERAAELIPPDAIHIQLKRGEDEQVRSIEMIENPL